VLVPGDRLDFGEGNVLQLVTERLLTDLFSDTVHRVSVQFAWDMYHELPDRYRDPSLLDYRLTLPGESTAAEALLAEHFGPGRPVVETTPSSERRRRWLAFEPFYLAQEPSSPGAVTIDWYDRKPEFAYDKPDEEVRGKFLELLAGFLAGCDAHEALVAFFQSPPSAAGIKITGPLNDDDFWFSLKPPMDALAFARCLRVAAPYGATGDVHMSQWSIREGADGVPPRIGRWEVEATLEHWPRLLADHRSEDEYDLRTCKPNRVTHVAVRPPRS
jgi:hypothetical protein